MPNDPILVTDQLDRIIHDLRISVTDRCNFRCNYCMPKEIFNSKYRFLARDKLLTFEEIHRLVTLFADLGVKKLRLTGGEPLLRRNLERLIEALASISEIEDISLTTNGSLLSREKAQALKDAGLKRITVSLDALDDETFMAMNDVGFPVSKVLEAIDNAEAVGLTPVKINMVVKKGVNDHSIMAMARSFHRTGHILRFIEYMDVGHSNGWNMDDVASAREIVQLINTEMPIEPMDENYYGEVANRWRFKDGGGEIGIIASVTQPFCGTCTRARLSAEGQLYTCLFATDGHDLRRLLRDGASDGEISKVIASIWIKRTDRYSELRSSVTVKLPKIEMSYIGG